MIKEKLEKLKKQEITAKQNIESFLKTIKEKDKTINAFLYVNKNALKQAEIVDEKIKKRKAGKLAGLAIAVKSNINVKGMPASCASKTLENYNATFDADVIKKIKQEDGIIIGMTNMDEFACGMSGTSSAFGKTINPKCHERIPGGSSSGSGAAVAADMCDIALGSDTGGSIRSPASNCGVIGVKPSYGRVSRYGLIDLAMSFDQIGPLCNDIYGCALMMEVISGKSDYDAIIFDKSVEKYTKFNKIEKIKIGISPEFKEMCDDKRIYEIFEKLTKKFADKTKSRIIEKNLKHVKLAVQAYYPIVYVEFFSGTRKFDGRKYGKKIEESCGEEVLKRIICGKEMSKAEHEGAYYRKALRVKDLIRQDFENAFREVDVLITPVVPAIPPKIGEEITPEIMYFFDALTVPANLAGICSGVVNGGIIDNVPVGVQISAPLFKEKLLLDIMNSWQDLNT
ncbi:MAG: Asp-tRNA(Asn)/Glu-tRNA(Gln) amidotransferase subunit GatA [Candidatus Nanoarchaeia archaeon]|nr:Asp-tRNA(Asn)/Glu-tRNA(Gln) amidotransferase subunit GatA [Candidatus Nanoarchaeia archaeon]